MAYDLDEQEQLDQVKAFWKKWGNLITAAITVASLAVAAYYGWQIWERKKAGEASIIFEQLDKAITAKNSALVSSTASTLTEQFKSTAYAQMGGLRAAKYFSDAGDTKAAKAQLTWVHANAQDSEYQHLAALRLAGVLLDEKAFDEALKLLSVTPPKTFEVLYQDRKGDVLLAQGKNEAAVSSYQAAYLAADKGNIMRGAIEAKLASIGAAPPPLPEKPVSASADKTGAK